MKRNKSKKYWYNYHLSNSIEAAQSSVNEKYEQIIKSHEEIFSKLKGELNQARDAAPALSSVLDFFHLKTDYYEKKVRPIESDLLVTLRAIDDLHIRKEIELREARKSGKEDFLNAREEKKIEIAEKALKAQERRNTKRLKYLEESPALRSAARALKIILINEQIRDGSWIICYYCGCTISAGESHLEHKKPISRGGKNNRSNLALSCAPCNLKKGNKTEQEYYKSLT